MNGIEYGRAIYRRQSSVRMGALSLRISTRSAASANSRMASAAMGYPV
jgi:hypothetical protein